MKNLSAKQIATSNFPYYRYTLGYALDSLQRIEVEAIEFYANDPHFNIDDKTPAEAKSLKKKLADHGLRVINWCPEQVKYPINIASPDPFCRKRSVEYYVKSIQFASEVECRSCQFFAGWNMLDRDFETTWKYSIDSLSYLADVAAGYGLTISIEAADPLVTVLHDTSYIKRMLKDVGAPNLKGMIDIYCLGICGETIETALANLDNDVAHCHFSDACYEGDNAPYHSIPGTGSVDLDHILEKLDEAGYEGYLSLELMQPYETCPEEAMQKAVDWMRKKLG